jgi:hypothetical protein
MLCGAPSNVSCRPIRDFDPWESERVCDWVKLPVAEGYVQKVCGVLLPRDAESKLFRYA